MKNYFKFLKYIFAVMGVVYLGIFISAFFLGGGFLKIFGSELDASYITVYEYMSGISGSASAGRVLSRQFIKEFIGELGDILNSDGKSAGGMAAYAAVSAAVVVAACQLSKLVCRLLIRRDVAGAHMRRGITVFIIRCAGAAVLAAAFLLASYLWIYSAVILAALNIVLQAAANLFYARFIYYPEQPLKQFLRPRMIVSGALANLLTLIITAAFTAAVWLLFNPFIALILAVPLVMYSMTVTEFTSVEYFRRRFYQAPARTPQHGLASI